MAQYFDRSPSGRDLQNLKRLRDGVQQNHRQMKGSWAEEQRKRLRTALADGKRDIERAHKEVEHFGKKVAHEHKERVEKDDVTMHGAHEFDEYVKQLNEHAHQTHAAVEKFGKEHGSGGGYAYEQAPPLGADGFFSVLVTFIVFYNHIRAYVRGNASHERELKKKAEVVMTAMKKVKAAAK